MAGEDKFLMIEGTKEIIRKSKASFVQSSKDTEIEDITTQIGSSQIQDGAITSAKIQNGAITALKINDATLSLNKIDWNTIEEVPVTLLNGVTAPDGIKLYRIGRIMFLSAVLTLPTIDSGAAIVIASFPPEYAPFAQTDYCCQMTGRREGAIYVYGADSPDKGKIGIEKIRQGYDAVACTAGWRIWVTQSWIIDGGND